MKRRRRYKRRISREHVWLLFQFHGAKLGPISRECVELYLNRRDVDHRYAYVAVQRLKVLEGRG